MNFIRGFWVELILIAGATAVLMAIMYGRPKRLIVPGTHTVGIDPRTSPQRIWRIVVHGLRLIGFAVVSLLFMSFLIALFRDIHALQADTASAPSQVEIPNDLPFEVEEVKFRSTDGLQMAGWYVPSKNGATIILLHGYGGNRLGTRWYAEKLVAAGYGVLMYDERASGESEGTYRSYGWEDTRDVGGAITFLKERTGTETKIGIAGCSIGGQIALQSASYYPEIGAVWADGPGIVRAEDIPPTYNPVTGIIIAANYMLDWMSEVKLGMRAPEPIIETISDIAPRPLALIGSGFRRPFIGSEEDLIKYYALHAGKNTQIWVIPEARHCDGPRLRPGEYSSRMLAYFNSAFGLKQ
jgi:pimeloyl-ACP methyl ester carboxylesterase